MRDIRRTGEAADVGPVEDLAEEDAPNGADIVHD